MATEDHDGREHQAIRHAQQPHPDADQRQVDDEQHQVADPHRGDHAPDEFRLLLHHLRTRHDAVNGHRADHQRHHRVRRNTERQQRDERGLGGGIVGAFGRRNAFDRAAAEPLRVLRYLLLERVGRERCDHGAAARQNAEDRAEHGAAQDRRRGIDQVLLGRHQARDLLLNQFAIAFAAGIEIADDLRKTEQAHRHAWRNRDRRPVREC